jgi:hypothetical protein
MSSRGAPHDKAPKELSSIACRCGTTLQTQAKSIAPSWICKLLQTASFPCLCGRSELRYEPLGSFQKIHPFTGILVNDLAAELGVAYTTPFSMIPRSTICAAVWRPT